MRSETRHILVSGRVQGVGFRDALLVQALRAGISGWVRNRRDGRVEAILQGSAEQVESVLAWARRGPPLARVTELIEARAEGEMAVEYVGFERLPTA